MQIRALLESPDRFPLRFDGDDVVFVTMDRDTYHASISCDRRIVTRQPGETRVNCSALSQQCRLPDGQPPGISYIFHIAHCGSTLLARALDIRDSNIAYREPLILRQLGVESGGRHYGSQPPGQWSQRTDLATTLLGRSYNPDEPIIVKANVPVNFMIPALLDREHQPRAIFLYLGLEHYLLAVLRTASHHQWLINVAGELNRGISQVTGVNQRLTLPQLAACMWLAQIRLFSEMLDKYPGLVSLDGEDFFSRPQFVLDRTFEYLGQTHTASTAQDIVNSGLFSRYSKIPDRAFNNETRLAMRDALKSKIGAELRAAREWVKQHTDACPIPERLPNSITGDCRALLGED